MHAELLRTEVAPGWRPKWLRGAGIRTSRMLDLAVAIGNTKTSRWRGRKGPVRVPWSRKPVPLASWWHRPHRSTLSDGHRSGGGPLPFRHDGEIVTGRQ